METKWNFYTGILQGHPSVAHTNSSVEGLSFIKDKLNVGKILVMGCADGNEVKTFKQLGYDPIGITLGETNIDWAKKNLPDCDVRLMDMHDLTFEPERY